MIRALAERARVRARAMSPDADASYSRVIASGDPDEIAHRWVIATALHAAIDALDRLVASPDVYATLREFSAGALGSPASWQIVAEMEWNRINVLARELFCEVLAGDESAVIGLEELQGATAKTCRLRIAAAALEGTSDLPENQLATRTPPA